MVAAVLAAIASAVLLQVPRLVVLPQNPFGFGIGPSLTTPMFTAFAVMASLAMLVVSKSRAVAFVLMVVVLAWVVAITAVEFKPVVALLPLAVAVPVVVLAQMLATRATQSGSSAWPGLAVPLGAAIVLISPIYGAFHAYNVAYGPTHAESTLPTPDWSAHWLWVGGVTATEATIVAGGLGPGDHVLTYWTEGGPSQTVSAATDPYGVARFELADLRPDTEHHYRVAPSPAGDSASGDQPLEPDSVFRTHAAGAQNLTMTFGSCARSGSNGVVFEAIKGEDPDLFVATGDLHYANLVSGDPADHIAALGRSISTPAQSALFSSTPSVWVWDDHDFGDNDSDSSSPSRDAASAAYRHAVPHHGVDPEVAAPIAQAFTVGRVRVVISDTRSMRTEDSMLGPDQEQWLVDELTTAANTHAVVVWVSPAPWISIDRAGSDQWGGFADDRARIANALADADVQNLVMVSGDYHATAIDDGTNSGYSDNGEPGFPVLHAGPLDRPGRPTGMPYSHGAFTDGGQYGVVEVIDGGGSTVNVLLSGKNWTGRVLTQLELEVDVPAGVPTG